MSESSDEFERLFGPRPEHDRKPLTEDEKLLLALGVKGGTHWPKVEERIRSVLDAFTEEMTARNFKEPSSRRVRKQWAAGARAWVDEFGEGSEELLVKSLSTALSAGWIVKSPGSLITMATNLRARGDNKTLEEKLKEAGYE